MASDVKWIKITTDIFDDEKILLIESLPDAYAVITVWFKLLCLAGKQNNSGVFIMNNQIPYTDKMLATIFRMNEATVTMAIKTFKQFGMVEVIDGVITIPNWGKHQNLDQLETKKAYQRKYMKEYREKQKNLLCKTNSNSNCKTNSKANVSSIDKDIDKEGEREEEKDKRINYQLIADMYNDICISFPRLTVLSDKRKKAIKARLNTYSVEQFQMVFEKAEASDFLRGSNNKNWSATFDWMITDGNFVKILDGNYDNKTSFYSGNKPQNTQQGSGNIFFDMLQEEGAIDG